MRNYQRAPEIIETRVEDSIFDPTRINSRPVEMNRFGDFSPRTAYGNWTKSLYPLNWFDSKTERTFANVLDEDRDVALWSRIQRGELTIQWEGGRYSPDFYVGTADTKYLIETKADRDIDTAPVQAKKAAAEQWARYVRDEGHGDWKYLLVAEEVLRVARSFSAVVQQVG